MNQKDFDRWNELKNILEVSAFKFKPFKEGQIWWCSLGVNLGSEQDGKNEFFERPVLILRRFNNEMMWALPITSTIKNDYYHYVYRNESIILSQLRLISSKRLQRFVESIPGSDLKLIRNKLIALMKGIKFQTPT